MTDDPNLEPLSDDPRLEALTGDPRPTSEPEAPIDPARATEMATLLEVHSPEARRLQLFALATVLGVLVLVAGVRSFTGRAVAAPMPVVMQVAAGVMAQPSRAASGPGYRDATHTQRSEVLAVDSGTVNGPRSAFDSQPASPTSMTPEALPTRTPAHPSVLTQTTRSSRRALAVDPADAQGTGSGCSAGQARIPLNTATLAQLDSLPGVGPVLAARILAWRTRHRGFSDVHELQEVPGIGPTKFAKLRPRVTL